MPIAAPTDQDKLRAYLQQKAQEVIHSSLNILVRDLLPTEAKKDSFRPGAIRAFAINTPAVDHREWRTFHYALADVFKGDDKKQSLVLANTDEQHRANNFTDYIYFNGDPATTCINARMQAEQNDPEIYNRAMKNLRGIT